MSLFRNTYVYLNFLISITQSQLYIIYFRDMENGVETSQISLPLFSGKPTDQISLDQHLFILETIAKSSGWNDSQKVDNFIKTLTRPAIDYFPKNWNDTFDNLKKHLCNQFNKKVSIKEKIDLRQTLIQNETENVQQFFERCKSVQILLCDRFYSEILYERELLLNFLIGLKSDLQDIVLKSDAKTLSAFLEAAIKVETVHTTLKNEVIDEIDQDDLDANLEDFLPEYEN